MPAAAGVPQVVLVPRSPGLRLVPIAGHAISGDAARRRSRIVRSGGVTRSRPLSANPAMGSVIGLSGDSRRLVFPLIFRRGVGALSPQNMNIANAAASGAAATGVLVGALAAIPIAGPIAAAIAGIGLALANIFSGCGQTCVEATNIANQVGAVLGQNLQTYLSAPVHYRSFQAACLNNFDTAWAALVQGCSNPQLGSAGTACVQDRQAGACKWKCSPFGWVQQGGSWVYIPAGPAGSGNTCWNWFNGMRDPIANDPTVVDDPTPAAAASSALTSVATAVSGSGSSATIAGFPLSDVLLGAALLAAAFLL